ncbi:transcription repressor OFP16-like [Tasmannia lanceolata]|uniref:transcription repressor OFP16-like n=1 Tax=Tasmannia lanceolata TaxID=3420 RepID=UPI00406468D5
MRNLHHFFSKLKLPSTTTTTTENDISTPQSPPAAPSSDLFKNFNSLYDDITSSDDSETTTTQLESTTATDLSTTSESDGPDLSTILTSHRFFFSSPGRSNSILDADPPQFLAAGGLAVPTYSPDPYADFRRSMDEMVKAQGLDVRSDWDRLHELLLCYLALNRKNTHKFIVGAFADLIKSLMKSNDRSESDVSGHRKSSSRPRKKEPRASR